MIERASSADLAFLAMDTGKVPQQFAVILQLEPSGDFSLPHLRQLISERILAMPRLRQRLIKVPVGCGRPVWVDDHDFDIDHIRAISCRHPGDEQALLDTALLVIMEPLPRRAPLWSVFLITELADGGAGAEVVVRGGQLMLRGLSPVTTVYRGFPLHPARAMTLMSSGSISLSSESALAVSSSAKSLAKERPHSASISSRRRSGSVRLGRTRGAG